MAARDAVKRVPEITRNHCPNPAKCARMTQMGPDSALICDHFHQLRRTDSTLIMEVNIVHKLTKLVSLIPF